MSGWPLRLVGVGVVLLLVGSLVWVQVGAQTSCGGGGGDKPPPIPETGNVFGKVVRVGSETGPARAADVRIQGTTIATSTGEDGSFRLVNVPVGRWTVVVSYREVTISFTTEITRGENSLPLPIEMQIGEPPIEDKRPPLTTITSKPGGASGLVEVENLPVSVEVEFVGEDDVTPAHRLVYSWQINNEPWSNWAVATLVTIEVAAEGVHIFRVKAKDEAGNENISLAVASFEVEVKEPPEDARAWGLEYVKSIQFPKGRGNEDLLAPYDLAVDRQGNFWFADDALDMVKKYSPSGQYLSSIAPYDPEAVTVDSHDNIYVCSFDDGLVQKFGLSGNEQARVVIAGASDIDLNERDGWAWVTRSQFLIKIDIITLKILDAWEYPQKGFYSSCLDDDGGRTWSPISGGEIMEIDTEDGQVIGTWSSIERWVGNPLKIPEKDLLIFPTSGDKNLIKGYRRNRSFLWETELPNDGGPVAAVIDPNDPNRVFVLDGDNCSVAVYNLVLMD